MADTGSKSPAPPKSTPAETEAAAPAETETVAPAGTETPAPTRTEAAPLEIDQDAQDDDSTLDGQVSAFTASLSSSVVDYPIEHGRQYHAYRKGSYLFPNDERELNRLDLMHDLLFTTLGGKLYLAPINEESIQNVLDVGTGTGALAIDIGDAIPSAQVIGCDLSPTQSQWTPPNVKFEVDDVESEWTYPFKFDFIISRYMAASISDWPKLVGRIYDNLAPGGWVELQDFDLEYITDDGSLTEDHDFRKWNKLFLDALATVNRDGRPGHKLCGYAEAAGFVNVQEQKFKIPMGPWAKHPDMKKTGMINLVQMLDGLEAFSLKTLDMLGYTRDETEVFLANVRKEMKGKLFHSYATYYVVYGQKPGGKA
ncbi:related to methyltransferase [Cephalotrichum gorgonifer]|uniref:Related to methyltransferase n=1 Tax=Cephalotrichum gorgonifer TaxID=2041049 RepID=A0AAE8MWF4_9PEZI|nr:related to methyltransferase [Cephalotrichum gorgonifer]